MLRLRGWGCWIGVVEVVGIDDVRAGNLQCISTSLIGLSLGWFKAVDA